MAGRGKKKEIAAEEMEKAESHALDGCKNNTICELMGWDHNLIEQRKDIKKKLSKKRAERKLLILQGQNKRAAQGSDAMLIWQGKNELEQTDKQETRLRGDETPIVVVIGRNVEAKQ